MGRQDEFTFLWGRDEYGVEALCALEKGYFLACYGILFIPAFICVFASPRNERPSRTSADGGRWIGTYWYLDEVDVGYSLRLYTGWVNHAKAISDRCWKDINVFGWTRKRYEVNWVGARID
jgi:hypothetical protein